MDAKNPQPTRTGLVDAIVAYLEPFAGEHSTKRSHSRDEVYQTVCAQIDLLRSEIAEEWTGPAVKETAAKLKKPLAALIAAMDELPPSNVFALWARATGLIKKLRDFQTFRDTVPDEIPSQNTDLVKAACAATAFRLIVLISEKRPTTTYDGPMLNISALLYETVTSNRDADMSRACKKCVKTIFDRHKRYGLPPV